MSNKTERILLRISKEEKEEIQRNAIANGFTNVSAFIRLIAKRGKINVDV